MFSFNMLSKKFAKNVKASVGTTMAISAIPMFLAAGLAIDYARAISVKTHIQAALDAGALSAAAATSLTDEQRAQLAKNSFTVNFKKQAAKGVDAQPNVTIVDGEAVEMSVDVEIPTVLMQITGINMMDFTTSVRVNIPKPKKAEIALVLDYSGSMKEVSGGQIKYVAMKNAAIDLVEDLTKKPDAASRIKFGLVPFSHHVYASLPGEYVVGGTTGVTWTGCTQDRKFPHNTNDTTPLAGNNDTKWGHPHAPVHAEYGCASYAPRDLIVKPISDDHAGVVSQLQAMRPYAWTHIALGFEFGWHLLSDSAPYSDVAANDDDTTEKYIVLLTDGRQTEPAFGPGGSRSVANGEQNLKTLCNNAKAQGITVVTVAFDLQDKPTENRLRECSTNPEKHFFVAEDGDELAGVFDQIKAELAELMYLAK